MFLFGARATGQSTWLGQQLGSQKTLWFDLLDLETESRLARDPSLLEREIRARLETRRPEWIVVDEVQKWTASHEPLRIQRLDLFRPEDSSD